MIVYEVQRAREIKKKDESGWGQLETQRQNVYVYVCKCVCVCVC